MGNLLSLLLIAAAGFFFMLANLSMKLLGHMPYYVLYPVVALAMAGGCYFEILALKGVQFAFAIVVILGLEMLLSVVIAHMFLGERYSPTNLVGIALVAVGIGLVHFPSGAPATAHAESFRIEAKPVKGSRIALPASAKRAR